MQKQQTKQNHNKFAMIVNSYHTLFKKLQEKIAELKTRMEDGTM